jgi:hypothetical protein
VLLVLFVGCGQKHEGATPGTPPPSESKPDVTVALEDFLKEYRADDKATKAKYAGKEVEFAATVWSVSDVEPFPGLMVHGGKDAKSGLNFIQDFRLRSTDAGKEKEFRLLSRGQKVTIRARGTDLPMEYGLDKIRIVDSSPSQARVTTVAEVAKGEKNAAEREKHKDHEVLVRVKVVEVEKGDFTTFGKVTDPDAPADAKPVTVRKPLLGTLKKEIEALKVGDVVTILAGVETEMMMPLAFTNPRIVKQAPAGLKLPGEK